MANSVPGIVQDGMVLPETPLPDGLNVQIVLPDNVDSEEAELRAEMAAWRAVGAKALGRVEELADEDPNHAQG